MPAHDDPAWIGVASAAAVRLAAEAGAEVDDLLRDPGDSTAGVLAGSGSRLQQSAELPEVAADLAGLLWAAECDEVPPIATILEEPAAQAALEAVAEARRQAAARLAANPLPPAASAHFLFPETAEVGTREQAPVPAPAAAAAPIPAMAAAPSPAVVASIPPARRPAAGAVLAGAAAAAILLFGRHLRRA